MGLGRFDGSLQPGAAERRDLDRCNRSTGRAPHPLARSAHREAVPTSRVPEGQALPRVHQRAWPNGRDRFLIRPCPVLLWHDTI